MKENKYKCVLCVSLITILVLLLSLGVVVHRSINVSNSSNINEQNLYNYLLEIDDILLDVYEDSNGFSEESMIDFSVQYILKNYDKFTTQIFSVNDDFVYRENDTEYIPQGYVETQLISKVIAQFFGKEKLDLTSHSYYNPNTQKFALISKRGDTPVFDNVSMEHFDIINDEQVVVTLKYTIHNSNITIKYKICTYNEQYYMQNIEICDIIG